MKKCLDTSTHRPPNFDLLKARKLYEAACDKLNDAIDLHMVAVQHLDAAIAASRDTGGSSQPRNRRRARR